MVWDVSDVFYMPDLDSLLNQSLDIGQAVGVHRAAALCRQCHELASPPWPNDVDDEILKQVSICFPSLSMGGSELHSNHYKMVRYENVVHGQVTFQVGET